MNLTSCALSARKFSLSLFNKINNFICLITIATMKIIDKVKAEIQRKHPRAIVAYPFKMDVYILASAFS